MINYFLGLGTTTDIAELFGNADELAITSYPNPFSAETNISFNLNQPSTVNLSIYDNTGRLVSNLINEQLPAGSHSATWNGAENSGRKVQNGLYVFKLEINGQIRTGKIVLKR
jgi:flagellar hook assembly protein FlgD